MKQSMAADGVIAVPIKSVSAKLGDPAACVCA